MYIESSAPRVTGDKARLVSPVYPPSGPKCFSFYYHMYGVDTGSLNVYVALNQTSATFSTEALMWKVSGNNQNQWNFGQFGISTQYTSKPYQVC